MRGASDEAMPMKPAAKPRYAHLEEEQRSRRAPAAVTRRDDTTWLDAVDSHLGINPCARSLYRHRVVAAKSWRPGALGFINRLLGGWAGAAVGLDPAAAATRNPGLAGRG